MPFQLSASALPRLFPEGCTSHHPDNSQPGTCFKPSCSQSDTSHQPDPCLDAASTSHPRWSPQSVPSQQEATTWAAHLPCDCCRCSVQKLVLERTNVTAEYLAFRRSNDLGPSLESGGGSVGWKDSKSQRLESCPRRTQPNQALTPGPPPLPSVSYDRYVKQHRSWFATTSRVAAVRPAGSEPAGSDPEESDETGSEPVGSSLV